MLPYRHKSKENLAMLKVKVNEERKWELWLGEKGFEGEDEEEREQDKYK
jgi:hypothetical protein